MFSITKRNSNDLPPALSKDIKATSIMRRNGQRIILGWGPPKIYSGTSQLRNMVKQAYPDLPSGLVKVAVINLQKHLNNCKTEPAEIEGGPTRYEKPRSWVYDW